MTCALLYRASLPAEYWLYALVHSVYLLNCLVHSHTERTPYEALSGSKPDLSHVWVFGSRVCIQCTRRQCTKLDRHDFTSIFLGYMATNQNVLYIDVNSGWVKSSHHAFSNKAWYRCGACLGGSKSNTINLILRLFFSIFYTQWACDVMSQSTTT
jgi:hypothetical protein